MSSLAVTPDSSSRMVVQLTQANQALAAEQQRTELAVQGALEDVLGTVQALQQENGALRASLQQANARMDQQQANFDTQLSEMRKLIDEQKKVIEDLTPRTSSLESRVQTLSSIATQLKNYMAMAYSTIWNGQKVAINDPL